MDKQQYLYKSPTHATNLNEMRLKDKWCDVTIRVNGREIRGHKVILAANLKYFDAMLSNDSFQESKEGVIAMESINETELETFVSYAYTGEILLTEDNALNLLELANYLSEDGIKKACMQFLQKNLKIEKACRAYKLADRADFLTLKNAAKETITKNFRDCSKSTDYLDFDYESLLDILSHGKAQPVKTQLMFFEGIMKWVVHDAENRKIHMKVLLSSIDVTLLKADDVMGCLYETTADSSNEYGIAKDAMFYYHTSKVEQKKMGHTLVLLGRDDTDEHYFQFYDFSEKTCSCLQKISNVAGKICSQSALLRDKFYFISDGSGINHLQEFDPTTKQNRTVYSSDSISSNAAVCADSKFLYLCGGVKKDDSESNQVLRYDPVLNSFKIIDPMKTRRSGAAAIFHEGCPYVLGGHDGSYIQHSVEKYNPAINKWTSLAPMLECRYGFAVAVLEGKLYVCGGYGSMSAIKSSVAVYDPSDNSWQKVSSMNKPREYFLVVACDGKLLAIGGDKEMTTEVYYPNKNQWQIDHEMSSGLKLWHPRGGLISSACVANAK